MELRHKMGRLKRLVELDVTTSVNASYLEASMDCDALVADAVAAQLDRSTKTMR